MSAVQDDTESNMDSVDDADDLASLLDAVSSNPSNYEAHLNLITACKENGELETLRQARRRMLENFPLSPNLWLDWIKDELNWAEESQRQQTVKQLFDQAVSDYVSFDLWLEYVQWACGTGDTSFAREVFERAVNAVGLHVSKGCLIWDAYREFELALLALFESKQDLESDSSNSSPLEESISKQKSLVISIFKRELSLPLVGIEEAYKDYIEFLDGQPVDKTIESSFESALKTLKSLQSYEDALDTVDKEKSLVAYWSYLDFESTNSACPPTRLKCLFERAITDNCLNADLWLRYLAWLEKKLKDKSLILETHNRAVRNCPWATKIWLSFMLSVERLEMPPETQSDVFSRSMTEGGYSSAQECSQLWLQRVYQLRRIAAKAENPVYSGLKQVLEDGEKFMKDKFSPAGWDADCSYRQAWARIEANLLKDISAFRKIYDDIMTEPGNGRQALAWLQYFNAECEFNAGQPPDWQHARKLLVKACNSVADYPEMIFAQLLRFELERGTLHDYDAALQRVEQQRRRIEERNIASMKKHGNEKAGQPAKTKKRYHPKTESNDHPTQLKSEIIKTTSQFDNQAPPKRAKTERTENTGFAVPAPPPVKRSAEPTVVAPTASSQMIASAGTVIASDGPFIASAGAAIAPSESNPIKPGMAGIDTSKYDRTVFVSNLDFKVDEGRVKSTFDEYGLHAKDIRLVWLKPGRSKGFGYVEFESPSHVAEAFKLDRVKIDGRPMYVSKCVDKKSAAEPAVAPSFTYETRLEKNKLFVKNVHGRATEADLEKFFKPYGKLSSVRLVVQKSGQSKGLAYIEYADEQSANKALVATDQSILMGRKLSVAISNPPPRTPRTAGSASGPPKIPVTTAASMMPRAVASSTVAAGSHRRTHLPGAPPGRASTSTSSKSDGLLNGNSNPTPTDEKLAKSNEEFRQMFLK